MVLLYLNVDTITVDDPYAHYTIHINQTHLRIHHRQFFQ